MSGMKRLLKLIGFLTIIQLFTLNLVNSEVYSQSILCGAEENKTDHFQVKCKDNVNAADYKFIPTFLILLSETKRKVVCSNSNNWHILSQNYASSLNQSKTLSINNCNLKNNTKLIRIAESLRAENSTEIRINNYKSRNTFITKILFQGLPNVDTLVFKNHKKLSNLEDDTFEYLPKLSTLHMIKCNIDEIPENIFRPVSNLTELLLYNNFINVLKPRTFQNLTMLKNLSLSDNRIILLDEFIFQNLTSLDVLNLARNEIIRLPEIIFQRLENLSVLNLLGNLLTSLPSNLFLHNLNLKYILLSKNSLKTLPSLIFSSLKKLEFLHIEMNNLSTLEENTFTGLHSLWTLNMNYNQLESVPKNIWQDLIKLKYLHLDGNNLTKITQSLVNITSLEEFSAVKNKITDIDKSAFNFTKNLKIINLAHNQISSFVYDVYFNLFSCDNLTEEDLSFKNYIEELDYDWFVQSETQLRLLNLSHNQISKINVNYNFTQKGPFYVDLTYNKIKTIDLKDLEDRKIETQCPMILNVGYNPIYCSFNIYHLLRYINGEMGDTANNTMIIGTKNLKCHGPKEYNNVLLSSVEIDSYTYDVSSNDFFSRPKGVSCPLKINQKSKLLIISCENKNFTQFPQFAYTFPGYKVELNMRNNLLTRFPNFNWIHYESITRLLLSGNKIKKFDIRVILSNVEVLDLRDNEIQSVLLEKESFKSAKLQIVTLKGNPLKCDSKFQFLLNNTHVFRDVSTASCQN